MKTFPLEILTVERVAFSGQVASLVLRGARGYFGVLAGHAPMVARLAPGRIRLTSGGREYALEAGAGFARVEKDRVSILLEDGVTGDFPGAKSA